MASRYLDDFILNERINVFPFHQNPMNISDSPIEIPVLLSRLVSVPDTLQNSIQHEILSSEFRGASTLYQQISILKNNQQLNYSFLSIIFNMKRTSLYNYYKSKKISK